MDFPTIDTQIVDQNTGKVVATIRGQGVWMPEGSTVRLTGPTRHAAVVAVDLNVPTGGDAFVRIVIDDPETFDPSEPFGFDT